MNKKKYYPPTYFNIAILVLIGLHFLFPITKLYNNYFRVIGIFPLVAGVWLNLSADKALKKYNTTVKPFEQSEKLIKDGIFGLTRNPMYLGMALILFSFGIFSGSLSTFLVLPMFMYLMNKNFISIEESMLSSKFGEQWNQYAEKTRRWI